MSDILQTNITVNVRNVNYTFRMPTIKYDIEMGYKATDIRRRSDPSGFGDMGSAGPSGANFAWYCAIMELYLVASDDEWPWSKNTVGKPAVQFENFPLNKTTTLYEVGRAFEDTFQKFRDDGDTNVVTAGTEAVAGVKDPGTP